MNFLAHAFLSFNDPEILVGNMISDFVKGRKQYDFDTAIQKGIKLHRQIDEYTDQHQVTKNAATIFKPFIGMYAGAFTDVVYDHFLARDINVFTEQTLFLFAENIYEILQSYDEILPEKFSKMLPYMRQQNWLFNYRELDGMEKSFAGIARRAKFLDSSNTAFRCFVNHYSEFEKAYQLFFPDLKLKAGKYYEDLMHT